MTSSHCRSRRLILAAILCWGFAWQAIEVLGEERVKWVHPDCGFWMLPRSVADAKIAALVAGRDKVLGTGTD